ncbi:uncharacterized protein LOC141586369 isoform X2 [Silene latifolia]|uniref:uncharacterized protein LOC141586369 isoform X2 n=1 Tax=Silene latifolia TaxID=37657 RepID=UPI003D771A46
MVETHNNKLKKLQFTEEDAYSLLQRYPASTILSVLREVAQYPSVKINWENLLKKTSSGIKSAAELQLLWRHLAYRHPLPIPPSPSSSPSDDDSDLEFEVEPFPPVSTEAAFEAANCVKVLACGSTSECVTTAEAEQPNGHASRLFGSDNVAAAPSSGQSEGIDVSASINANANNFKKKRKWTDEEDSQLLAGVRKWGEGNWAAILREGSWARTPSQLSQRWANMRRRQGTVNVGAGTSTGQHLSEAQLATRRAIDLALKDNLTAAVGSNNAGKPKVSNGESPGSINTGAAQRQISQAATTPASTSAKAGVIKPRAPVKKAATKTATVSDSIQRTAVAAGARIVNPSDADALRNFANVHFFRSGTPVPVAQSFASGGPPAKDTIVKASLPAAAGSQLPKPRSLPAVCSSASANDRILKKEEKTPIEVNETTQMGNPANEGNDEALKQVVMNPVLVDVSETVSTTQVSGAPVMDGKLESFKSSVADESAEKMEISSEGLAGAK